MLGEAFQAEGPASPVGLYSYRPTNRWSRSSIRSLVLKF